MKVNCFSSAWLLNVYQQHEKCATRPKKRTEKWECSIINGFRDMHDGYEKTTNERMGGYNTVNNDKMTFSIEIIWCYLVTLIINFYALHRMPKRCRLHTSTEGISDTESIHILITSIKFIYIFIQSIPRKKNNSNNNSQNVCAPLLFIIFSFDICQIFSHSNCRQL